MRFTRYIKDKINYILGFIVYCIIIVTYSNAMQIDKNFIIVITILSFIFFAIAFWLSYRSKNNYIKSIEEIMNGLEEKYLISELIKKPKNLENEAYYYALKKATKAMNDKITELEHKYQDYEEYIETFVHEVKTPLAAISLYSDNKKDHELKQEVKKIDNLVEQVLFYARSENTEKDYFVKKIKLSEIIHQVMLQNKDYLLANKIIIEVENSDVFVATDEKWVIFILNQILNNSIKYMDKDEKRIKLNVIEDKNKVILEMKDNGCGIKESDISRVFDKGFTGSNRKKEHSTGMGLYLCKKLCDRLHLNIAIESKEKEYTTVIIIFPKSSLHE